MSAASEPKPPNQEYKNAKFERINPRKRQVDFYALFGRNDCSQIIQEDIPRNRVAIWKHQNLKFKRYLLFSSPSFSSFSASTDKKTPTN